MSEALIASLNNRISQLETDKAQLGQALKQSRGEAKAAKAERDQLATSARDLTAERDRLKAAADAGPADLQARIAGLEGEIAGRDHRDSFRDAALASGVKPEAVGDLYSLSGLKPGDAAPKPEDFAGFLSSAKEGRPWAFGEAPAPAVEGGPPSPVTLAKTPAPAGGGRGASDTTSGLFTVRRSDMTPAWMQTNQSKLAEHAEAGTLRVQD